MGGQISVNYTEIVQTRTVDCWKVHSAVRKTTGEKVSLWIIDQDLLNNKFPDKTAKNKYLDRQIVSLQTMRKIIHPHVLKILEIIDKKPDVGFASEPIDNMEFLNPRELHKLDATYISYQVAETLSFINIEAHFLYLGLTPSSVLIDNELNIHLMNFDYSTPLTGQEIVPSPQLAIQDPYADNTLRPPEYLGKKELSNTSDVFLFGLFFYNLLSGKKLYENGDPSQLIAVIPSYARNITGVPPEFMNILTSCLNSDPIQRPAFSRIIEDPAFNSMQMKSLRYIDMILTKQPADKFKFYKGLASKIDYFSPKLLRTKILPKLLEECKNDIRFAPILLASIFQISKDYDSIDFQNNVWAKISFLSGVSDPPEVAIALLRNIWLLLKKLDIRIHKDYVYPIFFTALQSSNARVQAECLEKVDLIIEEMNETSIQSSLIPRLMELTSSAQDANVSAGGLKCVAKCLHKIDNESFIVDYFQKIVDLWNKRNGEAIANAIYSISENINASPDALVVRVVPLLALIAGSHSCKEELKVKLCNLIIKFVSSLRDAKEIVDQKKQQEATVNETDNPFAPQPSPAKKGDDKAEDIFGTTPSKPVPPISAPPSNKNDIKIDVFGTDMFGSKPKTGSNSGLSAFDRPQSTKPTMDLGFGSTTTTTTTKPSSNATLDLGFGSTTTNKPSSNATLDLGFGSSQPAPSKPASNTFDFGLGSSPAPKQQSKPQANSSFDFGLGSTPAASKPSTSSSFDFGFGSSPAPSKPTQSSTIDLAFGNSPAPSKPATSSTFGSSSGFTDFTATTATQSTPVIGGFGPNATGSSSGNTSMFRDNGFGGKTSNSGFGSNNGTAAFRDSGFGGNTNTGFGSSSGVSPFVDSGFGGNTSNDGFNFNPPPVDSSFNGSFGGIAPFGGNQNQNQGFGFSQPQNQNKGSTDFFNF